MSPGDGEPADEESEFPPPGSILARYATIVAQGFDLEYAIRLTPAQINLIHGHKRDDDGNIKQPEAPIRARRKQVPATLENTLLALEQMKATGLLAPGAYDRARAEILKKFNHSEPPAAPAAPRPNAPRAARPQPKIVPPPARPNPRRSAGAPGKK